MKKSEIKEGVWVEGRAKGWWFQAKVNYVGEETFEAGMFFGSLDIPATYRLLKVIPEPKWAKKKGAKNVRKK
jgi:hypothetical protein